ncbi:hypothetical protein ACNOYE_26930 [Nannocystaceae bacterium ST9]
MTRARHLLSCSCLAMLAACTSSAPAPAPIDPEPPGESMTDISLDSLARACDGARLRERIAERPAAELEAFVAGESASVRLLAIWERDRSFAADGSLVPTSVDPLARELEVAIGQPPPRWWLDQLAAAKLRPGEASGPPYYDVGLTAKGDRRGEWQAGPGTTRVRSVGALLLSETAGQLSYDLSMGRVVLGPLPSEPGTMIEHARARAGTTIYYASFSPGSGGFRFPLHAVDSNGSVTWTAEVCGPDRQALDGLGHLTVEIVVLDSGDVAVFSAESHGVALDVFDPETGARTLAWSSDFWFTR